MRWICERDRLHLDPRADSEVRRTTIGREDRGGTIAGGPALQGGKKRREAPKGGEEARGHRAGAVRKNDDQRIDRPGAGMVQGCPVSPILPG